MADQANPEIDRLKQENEKLNKEKNQITSENNTLKQDKEKLAKENAQFTSEKNALKVENEKLTKENAQFTSEKNALKVENEKLTKENAKIASEKIVLNQEKEKLTKENAQFTSEKIVLNQEKEKLTKEKAQIASEKNKLKDEYDELVEERDQINSEKDTLEQEIEKLTEEKNQISTEINQSKKENEKEAKEKNQIISEINQLKQENEKITNDLNNYKNSMKYFISQMDLVIHHNLLKDMNKLNRMIQEIRQINLKEIRNIKLPQECCLSDISIFNDFVCSICSEFVENPVYCSACGTLNCRDCMTLEGPCPSPNCREEYKEAQIPRTIKNLLQKLNFRCPLKCSKEFTYESKERHFSECVNWDKSKSKCSLCNSFLKKDLTQHFESCEQLKINCLYCDEEMTKFDLEQHMMECDRYTKPCQTCKTGYPNRFEIAHSEFYCRKIVALKEQIEDFIQFN